MRWGGGRACKALPPLSGIGRASPRPEGRGEAGQLGGLEALVFGVLVFVLGTIAIANAWGVLDAKGAATSAAVNAARAYVQDVTADPLVAARSAAAQTISDSGRSPSRMELSISGAPARCASVTAEVRYRVPLVSLPVLGGLGSGFTVRATHTELADPYRSGLPGEAPCTAT